MAEILYQQKYYSIDNVWNIIIDIKGMVVHAKSYLLFQKSKKEKHNHNWELLKLYDLRPVPSNWQASCKILFSNYDQGPIS